AGELDETGSKSLQEAEEQVRQNRPLWLRWNQAGAPDDLPTEPALRQKQLETLALTTIPQARARFTNEKGPAYLIERRIGRGNVMFVSSGLFSTWSTMPMTDTFFMFDRILRSMIRSTLPERNYAAVEQITLPLPSDDREAEISLKRPGREDDPEPLESGAIGKDQRGVTVYKPLVRGLYHIAAAKPAISAADKATTTPAWDLVFTVNGDGTESDLTPLARETFDERSAGSEVRWVGAADSISLAGSQISGQNSWKYFVLLVLLFLLAEILILAWPSAKVAWEERRTLPQQS
ncbi:MAG TPA: hypothetical protein VL096_08930, partial [Pirellulaceae bacterium]|nr:hypothetical protein [Pirellulaceae bacterium]